MQDSIVSSSPSPTSEHSAKPLSNLALRLLTTALFVPLILSLIWFAPPLLFQGVLVVVAILCAAELAGMCLSSSRLLASWSVLSAALMLILRCVLHERGVAYPFQLELTIFVLGAWLLALIQAETCLRNPGLMAWAVVVPLFVVLTFDALIQLRMREHGAAWFMLALTIAWFSDTLAFMIGKRFGRRRFAPRISPGKTVEGSIAGVIGAVFAVWLAKAFYLQGLAWLEVACLGLIVGMLSQLGDLAESLIKRQAGFKDSGTIIPGHGGMLDRLDSFLFASLTLQIYVAYVR